MVTELQSIEAEGSLDSLLKAVIFEGQDSKAFLQAQLSCDLSGLNAGDACLGAWLNPKGRVLATAWWVLTNDAIVAITTGSGATMLTGPLQRYVLRSKVTMAVGADWSLAGSVPAAITTDAISERPSCALRDDGFDLTLPDGRRLHARHGGPSTGTDIADAWTYADILAGIPQIHAQTEGKWTAQATGLDRLGAVSVKKGCYPGQEIVARTHFLGRGKRVTARGTLGGPAEPGEDVIADERTRGSVIQAISAGSAWHALITAHEDALTSDLHVNSGKIHDLVPF